MFLAWYVINALTSVQADITLDVAGIVRRNERRSVGLRLGLYRVPCGRQISGNRPSDENCKYRESCHADIQAGEFLMLNITASGNFTDRLKRAQIARQSVNRKRANRSPAMPDSNLPAQALHFLHRIWSIAMPRAPKDLADQVAARRRRTRADCNTSHLIDRKAALPNPFVEVGEQGQPRNRKVSGTTKPTCRKR